MKRKTLFIPVLLALFLGLSFTAVAPAQGNAPAKVVNLNTADRAALLSLPGIGPATAERILAYREKHGKFRNVDELLLIRGIGAKKLARIRPLVKV